MTDIRIEWLTASTDCEEATLDLAAMKRLYKYMTGEVL